MGLALSAADIDRLTSEAQAAGIATVDELIAKFTVAEGQAVVDAKALIDHAIQQAQTAIVAPVLAEIQVLRADLAAALKLVSGGIKVSSLEMDWKNGYVAPPNI